MRKKLLATLLALCMIVGLMVAPVSAAAFDDVSEDHWAASAIERWAGFGVVNGIGDGKYDPSGAMTRAQFAQLLVNMLGLTAKGTKVFPDVPEDAWFAEAISIAEAAGIINGRSDGSADPYAPVSFEEAAVMMCRALGLAKTTGGADWAKESIEKLTELGMIGEDADEHLQVGVECNRAVVAALADSIVGTYANDPEAETTEVTGEVKGVVLAVNGAKVEVKDATVKAPIVVTSEASVEVKGSTVEAAIVVNSASVALTETKAADVVVAGEKASVTADKESSVADVTVSGTAPAIEIDGEVSGTVTVEAGTTDVEIKGDGVNTENVTNNTTEEIKVNDEPIEGKPAEENPGEETDPAEEGEGSVSGSGSEHYHKWAYSVDDASKHKAICTGCGATATSEQVTLTHDFGGDGKDATNSACTKCGYTTKATAVKPGNTGMSEGHTHTYTDIANDSRNKAATCTAAGVKYQRCNATEGEGDEAVTCGAEQSVAIPATGHTYVKQGAESETPSKAPTCTASGYDVFKCSTCNHTYRETKDATGEHTYVDDVCSVCGKRKPAATAESHDAVYTGTNSAVYEGTGTFGTHTKKCQFEGGCSVASHTLSGQACSSATTTNEGWVKSGANYTKTCQYCGGVTSQATCPLTGAGHTTAGTCDLCDAHVHNWGTATEKTAGNCVDAAQMEHECTLCHTKEDTTGGTVNSSVHKGTEYDDGTPGCTACNPDKTSG